MARRLVDLSHAIESGMITYRGLPAPLVCDFLSRADSRRQYAPGTEFQIGKIEMVANTGTYVDSPFHRYQGGKDLAALPLTSLANIECLVARAAQGTENVLYPMREALKCMATVGEVCGVLRAVWGEYHPEVRL